MCFWHALPVDKGHGYILDVCSSYQRKKLLLILLLLLLSTRVLLASPLDIRHARLFCMFTPHTNAKLLPGINTSILLFVAAPSFPSPLFPVNSYHTLRTRLANTSFSCQLLFWSLKNNLQCPVEGYRVPAELAAGGRDGARASRASASGRSVMIVVVFSLPLFWRSKQTW